MSVRMKLFAPYITLIGVGDYYLISVQLASDRSSGMNADRMIPKSERWKSIQHIWGGSNFRWTKKQSTRVALGDLTVEHATTERRHNHEPDLTTHIPQWRLSYSLLYCLYHV